MACMRFLRGAMFLPLMMSAAFAGEVYFSPNGHVRDHLIEHIQRAQKSIVIAMYSFTADPVAAALEDAHRRGVQVRVIRDLSQTSEKTDEDAALAANGIPFHVLKGLGRGIMHNKFAVFDGVEAETGSYNWTNNAELDNYENAYFFTEPAAVQAYAAQFEKLWALPPLNVTPARSPHHIGRPVTDMFAGHPMMSMGVIVLIMVAVLIAIAS